MMTSWKITLAVALVAMISVAIEEARVDATREKVEQAALATANVIAARDSTRDLALENARVAKLAGDSLRIVERRVVQVQQRRDALDDALRREKKAAYALSAHVDSLSVERVAPTTARSEATFHVREEPYTVDASIALPPPPDSARLRLRIALDKISLRLRVTCKDITDASVVVDAPSWAHVTLGAVSQDPEVCASRRARSSGSSIRWRIRPVLGVGRVLTGVQSGWGVFVGLGLTLGSGE